MRNRSYPDPRLYESLLDEQRRGKDIDAQSIKKTLTYLNYYEMKYYKKKVIKGQGMVK